MSKKEEAGKTDNPIVQKKVRDSLKISIHEGAFSSTSIGLGRSYFSPFALALNATATQMGILYAVIGLLPSIIQLRSAILIEKFSRKRLVLIGALWRIFLMVPIILTGVLFYFGVPYMVWALIAIIGLYYSFGAMSAPIWFSWMGLLVPEKDRGDYFAVRNRVSGFFGVVAMVCGAFILDYSKRVGVYLGNPIGFTLLGFGILFILAGIAKIGSWRLLHKQYEPRVRVNKRDYFSFKDFLEKGISTPFGRFTLFRGAFGVAVGISTPFWALYMLRDLHFSYIWYMMITVSAIVFQLIFLPLIGKFSDRFGNIKLLRICSWLIVTIPLWWILSVFISGELTIKLYLLIVPAIIGGFGWAGFNLAVNNYVYDAVRTTKRSFGVTYMNLIVGVGTFVGAIIGSLLAWLNISFINPLLFIFAISAVIRLLIAAFGLRLLHEVRHVHKFSSQYLIKEFQPVQGVVREVHYMGNIAKKAEHYI